MKTILVAIDFSKNAEHALEYALTYAEKLEASIHLIWVDNNISEETTHNIIKGNIKVELKDYLKKLTDKYKSFKKGNKIDIILRQGKVYQEVAKVAKEINADMIFAGTHGVSGYEQHWIGSNAYRIVTQSPCPVFTVRSAYNISNKVSKILLPLDNSNETIQKLPFIINLAAKFNSTIYLLKVYSTKISLIRKQIDKFSEEAKNCVVEKGVNYVIDEIEATNVTSSIIEYSNNNKMDLISIMTEQDSTTAGKILGQYSRQLINNSTIPVVSVRATKH